MKLGFAAWQLVMACHGLSWLVMACHGLSWLVMACHGLSWLVMACHGLSWLVMACHGFSTLVIKSSSLAPFKGCLAPGWEIGHGVVRPFPTPRQPEAQQLFTSLFFSCFSCASVLQLFSDNFSVVLIIDFRGPFRGTAEAD